MVLTSLPPKYQYSCPHCGAQGYVLCSEVSNYRFRADVLDVIRNAALYSVKCLICGEEHEFRGNTEQPYICDKCKNAVIKMRKIFEAIEEEED
jgi:transcription elongation factor Elf1